MITILNQPYLPLDNYIDLKKFDEIVDDIILGIAKSKYAAGPSYPGPGYLDKSKKSAFEIFKEIMADPKHPYHEKLKNLKNWEPYNFIQYKWPSHTLNQCLILQGPGVESYHEKHEFAKCKTYEIMKNFIPFKYWLDNSKIFESYGRVLIFLNEKGTDVLDHRDYVDGISKKDQFIWISPLGTKNFYVRDEHEKFFVKSRFCIFDNANIHGGDPSPAATFSIRIDGIFTKQFLKKTGLDKHFD